MITAKLGTHFEGDLKFYVSGAISFKELAELIMHLYRNEDRRIVMYPYATNFQGRQKLKDFLTEALKEDTIPVSKTILRKYGLD